MLRSLCCAAVIDSDAGPSWSLTHPRLSRYAIIEGPRYAIYYIPLLTCRPRKMLPTCVLSSAVFDSKCRRSCLDQSSHYTSAYF